ARALECRLLYRHAALSRDPSARLWRRLWRGGGLCLPFTSGAGLAPRAPPPTPAPACSGRAIVPALDPASGDLAGAAARDETHASRDPAAHAAPRGAQATGPREPAPAPPEPAAA